MPTEQLLLWLCMWGHWGSPTAERSAPSHCWWSAGIRLIPSILANQELPAASSPLSCFEHHPCSLWMQLPLLYS